MVKFIKSKLKKSLNFLFGYFSYFSYRIALLDQSTNKTTQLLLCLKYKEFLHQKTTLPKIEDIGFGAFSQNDEDGILLYIFSLIDTVSKKCVEICAGNGIVCNTANLIINHGWNGLLFDGIGDNVKEGRKFYSRYRDTWIFPPKFVHVWIDAENVNNLIKENGFGGEIDLLSLDLDGVDYWIWKAIDCINPRVVIVEYNTILGPEKAISVPYKKDFNRFDYPNSVSIARFGPDYWGASLAAFRKLGYEKGYRLVGCNRYGFNAFFIRKDIGEDILPEISPEKCFEHPFAIERQEKGFSNVMNLNWIEV
jgi:hypothetical protein